MARYTATEKVFVNNTLVEPGVEFESDATPGKFWIEVEVAEPKTEKAEAPKKDGAAAKPKDEPALA